jgi:hypothetical protein
MVWLADEQAIPVYQWDGIWDLSPLSPPGRVTAWAAFTDEPEVRPWPLLPVARPGYYRSRNANTGERQP